MRRIKAAVLRAPDVLNIEEVEEPACPSGGVLIDVVACAVCPSDIKMARIGHRDLSYPRILGHEAVGEIVESRSPDARVGDIVQVWPGIACGTCPSCRSGRDNLCERQGIIGFNADGGFAERMAVASWTVARGGLNPLPSSLDPTVATMAEPLGCCVHAQEAVRIGKHDKVVVHGGGPLGLMHAALARRMGAEVMIVEPMEERRRVAFVMGADLAVSPEESVTSIEEWTRGRGADVAILATPQIAVDDALLRAAAPGGRICLFSGLPRERSAASFDMNALHYRELLVVGTYGCTSSSNSHAVDMIAGDEIDLTPLISGRYHLGSLEDAFRAVERRAALKCIVTEFDR